MKFGTCLACLLQKQLGANPAGGPVWLSQWDISDAFHWFNLRLSDVIKFNYVVSPLPEDTSIILCINLVLTMGWVNSPYFFCDASDMVADNANV